MLYKYPCQECGKERQSVATSIYENPLCRQCWLKKPSSGANRYNWKGGRSVKKNGYVMILAKKHPYAKSNGYVFEHRLVMEKHLGRYLVPGEEVHHKNRVHDDNRLENLVLTTSREHRHKYHQENRKCTLCDKKHLAKGLCVNHYAVEARRKKKIHAVSEGR